MSKHHCRACGQGVCGPCSTHNKPVPSRGWDHPVRVCDSCHARTDSLWPFPPGKLLKVHSVFLRWATKHCESWHCCSLETRKGTKWQVWNQPLFYVKRELLRYVEGWPSGFHRSVGICFRSLLPSWATDFISAVRWLTASTDQSKCFNWRNGKLDMCFQLTAFKNELSSPPVIIITAELELLTALEGGLPCSLISLCTGQHHGSQFEYALS